MGIATTAVGDYTFAVGNSCQEVKDVIPEAIEKDGRGYLTLNNDPVIMALVNAVKELKEENELLKERVARLED